MKVPTTSIAETIFPRILIPGVVIAVGLYLMSISSGVPILDTRLFYTPEEALLYFRGLDSYTREAVLKVSMVDMVFFVPAYGLQLWWFSRSFNLGKVGMKLLITALLADTFENVLILTAVTLISPPSWALVTLLSIMTPLKWAAIGAWGIWFVIKVLTTTLRNS
jgi:hypothetical protein